MRGSIGWWCVLSVAWLAAPLAQAKEPPRFAWPEGQKAAVNLGYDDALDSQLDNAIPALDRHGLKGTFYVVSANPPLQLRMDDWRAAARNGHELGNHSLFHQCSAGGPGREWVKPERDLDAVTVAQMAEQVALANTFLQALDGRGDGRTFTAPCGDRTAKDGDYIRALGDLFVGIKMVGGPVVVPDMSALDPRSVPAHVPVDATGAQLIALVKQAARRGHHDQLHLPRHRRRPPERVHAGARRTARLPRRAPRHLLDRDLPRADALGARQQQEKNRATRPD